MQSDWKLGPKMLIVTSRQRGTPTKHGRLSVAKLPLPPSIMLVNCCRQPAISAFESQILNHMKRYRRQASVVLVSLRMLPGIRLSDGWQVSLRWQWLV